jgi:hypothetical protein
VRPIFVLASSLNGVTQPRRYMLSDILAIRCDRDRYYYGRDQLWAVHPSIVQEIVAHVPVALTELLDGCMWKSSHTDMGVRRVSQLFVASSARSIMTSNDVTPKGAEYQADFFLKCAFILPFVVVLSLQHENNVEITQKSIDII